jgi:hypothetical protein
VTRGAAGDAGLDEEDEAMPARPVGVFVVLCGLAPAACSGGGTGGDPCAGVECSSRGYCLSEAGVAYCSCLDGFHPEGLACEANDPGRPCEGVDCSGHGECLTDARGPWCDCAPGYHHPAGSDLVCLPEAADGGGEHGRDGDRSDGEDAGGGEAGDGETETETGADDAADAADAGGCRTAADCNDGVGCTTDSCDTGSGRCAHEPRDAACSDDDVCDGTERCDAARGCLAGTPRACDDGVDCTRDSCVAASGCRYAADDSRCAWYQSCNARRGCVDPATTGCRRDSFSLADNPAWGTATLVNCADADAHDANNILSNSDAAYLGLMRSTDVYLANNEWVAWVDMTTAPGILRGLWAKGRDWREAAYGGMLKSVLQVVQGYFGPADPSPHAYTGLHVEIWRTPDGPFYVWPARGPEGAVVDVPADHGVAQFSTTLVDLGGGSSYTDTEAPHAVTQLRFYTAYWIFPYRFEVHAALGANAPTHVGHHAGGLLLLLSRACPPFGSCSVDQVRAGSFHLIATSAGVPVTTNGDVDIRSPTLYDMFGRGHESFEPCVPGVDPGEDRTIVTQDRDTVWALGPEDTSAILLRVTPRWEGGANPSWGRLIAYHYNSPCLGLTGFGSLDLVVYPGAPTGLYIDSTNQLRWVATLSHH